MRRFKHYSYKFNWIEYQGEQDIKDDTWVSSLNKWMYYGTLHRDWEHRLRSKFETEELEFGFSHVEFEVSSE